MNYRELKQCLACGRGGLTPYLDLGEQPLANSFTEKPTELPKYPLKVKFCPSCSHSQLSVVVDPKLLFENYLYVSGTTKTLDSYFETFVEKVSDVYINSLRRDKTGIDPIFYTPIRPSFPLVLEIGCNDGTLLGKFKDKGWQVEGVDPADNLRPISKEKGIPVLVDYWSSDTAWKMGKQYDLICGLNVFAHNQNPADFLKGCARVLKPNGIVVIEFPYHGDVIKNMDLGNVYHEHISYWTIKSMTILAERCGFYIHWVDKTPIHGGSVRFYLKRGLDAPCGKLGYLIQEERELGLHDFAFYSKFRMKLNDNMFELINHIKRVNSPLIAYGASAKSSTLFSWYPGSIAKKISYIVDDNPLKCGRYSPGTNIPIYSTEKLREETNPVILMTTHNFKTEIVKKIKELNPNASLLNYVPRVKLESIANAELVV